MGSIENIKLSLKNGNSTEIRKSVLQGLEEGVSHESILEAMLETMEEIGLKFKNNELFVPEVLIIGRAFNIALEMISPMLENQAEFRGTVVIGTVKGDLHDIGKNLVKLLMGSMGVKVIDLGVNVSPEAFVEAVIDHKPDILAMSALLTTTMNQIKATIRLLEKKELRDSLKVIIGGAPVTNHFATNVGADYYASDAGNAAELVLKIIKEKNYKN